jgi:hypothetical protein
MAHNNRPDRPDRGNNQKIEAAAIALGRFIKLIYGDIQKAPDTNNPRLALSPTAKFDDAIYLVRKGQLVAYRPHKKLDAAITDLLSRIHKRERVVEADIFRLKGYISKTVAAFLNAEKAALEEAIELRKERDEKYAYAEHAMQYLEARYRDYASELSTADDTFKIVETHNRMCLYFLRAEAQNHEAHVAKWEKDKERAREEAQRRYEERMAKRANKGVDQNVLDNILAQLDDNYVATVAAS